MTEGKIMVEREPYEKDGKTFQSYFIKGTVRGVDFRVRIVPPDFGGYTVLDIVYAGEQEAELVLVPYEITDEKTGRVTKGNSYAVHSEDEDGTVQHSTYPIASRMVEAPGVIWAYNNGMYLSDGKFGMVCHTGAAGEPREANTYADAPVGRSYIECIGQITENTQTFRIVYQMANKEVNFVLRPSDLG